MPTPSHWMLIALGGALGAMARHGLGLLATRAWGGSWPYGTLAINVLGTFVLGFVVQSHNIGALSEEARLGLGVGVCGAFTTFSTFSVDVLNLAREGRSGAAALYAALSFALSVGAALGGTLAARHTA